MNRQTLVIVNLEMPVHFKGVHYHRAAKVVTRVAPASKVDAGLGCVEGSHVGCVAGQIKTLVAGLTIILERGGISVGVYERKITTLTSNVNSQLGAGSDINGR